MDKGHRMGVQSRRRAEHWKAQSFPLSLHPSWKWWIYCWNGNSFCSHIIHPAPHFSSPHWNHHWTHMWSYCWSGNTESCSLSVSYSFIVCVSPQHVTPAFAEQRVVVCSQRAWGWRRLQTLRFTPKEPAPESWKSPSRDPVSYTENTSHVFTVVRWFINGSVLINGTCIVDSSLAKSYLTVKKQWNAL